METPLYKVGFTIATAFVMPAITYLLGVIWFTAVGARDLERTWRVICVLFPIFVLGMLPVIRFDIIRGAWEQSPVLAAMIYSFGWIVVPFGSIAWAIRLWRTPDH